MKSTHRRQMAVVAVLIVVMAVARVLEEAAMRMTAMAKAIVR